MYNKETIMPSRVAQTRRSKKSTRRSIRRSGKTIKRRSRGVRGGDGKHTQALKLVGTGAVVAAGTLGVGVMLSNQNLRRQKNANFLAAIKGFKKIPEDDLLELLEIYRDEIPYDCFTGCIKKLYLKRQDNICQTVYNVLISNNDNIPNNLQELFDRISKDTRDTRCSHDVVLDIIVLYLILWYMLDCNFVTLYLIKYIKNQQLKELYPHEQEFLKYNAIKVIALYLGTTDKEAFCVAYLQIYKKNAFYVLPRDEYGVEAWSESTIKIEQNQFIECDEPYYLFDHLNIFVADLTPEQRTCILLSARNQKNISQYNKNYANTK